ncbi:probable glutamate receptor [Haliotis cracherodii]|uniref:probable glutamate receptor n=1 Tax=Haliotis cracherodii TaxID=6455 RepID=UPI0039ECD635
MLLVNLLIALNWQSVLVLRELELGVHFPHSLETSGISYVDYDISSSKEEDLLTMLRDVENVLQPHIHVLLLCDVTTTVSVLRQLSGICGTRSNSSVDWCHVSRVLVVGKSDDLPVLLDSNIKLENVALLELPTGQGDFTKPRMWTLMIHPNGRAFADVALSDVEGNVTEVFSNVRFGYNGRQLTVVMKTHPWNYGYEIVNKRKVSSLSLHILQMLAVNLNFSYEVISPRESVWGKNKNGSWTGVLGMLQRREADLAADHITIHIDRYSVADFILPPVFENKRIVLFRKEEPDQDHLLVFLRPFQSHVFIVLGVSLFFSTVLLSSVRFIKSHLSSKDKNVDHNLRTEKLCPSWKNNMDTVTSTTFELYGACLKQGSERHVSHDSDRIFVAAWWMFTTIISAVYSGTIVATFAIKLEKPPFSNLTELVAREDNKIGYDSSSITQNLFQNTKQSDIKGVVQRVRDLSVTDPDVLGINITKHLQRVHEGKYAFISGTVIVPLSYADCRLQLLDTKFGHSYTAFHLPKSSPFKQDLEKTMYHLRDSGILQRTMQEWLQSAPKVKCPVESFPKAVSLIKIQSMFFAVGIGLICSFLILVAEIVWYKGIEGGVSGEVGVSTDSLFEEAADDVGIFPSKLEGDDFVDEFGWIIAEYRNECQPSEVPYQINKTQFFKEKLPKRPL